MIRQALILGAASLSLLFRDPGCSGEDVSANGLNAPCTRDRDCADGLECQGGACVGPQLDAGSRSDADAEAGRADAGGDG